MLCIGDDSWEVILDDVGVGEDGKKGRSWSLPQKAGYYSYLGFHGTGDGVLDKH